MKTTIVSHAGRIIAALVAAAIAAVAIGLSVPGANTSAQPMADFDTSPM